MVGSYKSFCKTQPMKLWIQVKCVAARKTKKNNEKQQFFFTLMVLLHKKVYQSE